ncbi:glycosyltransferase family 2 protein [Winogradskyella sp. UBA3174]|uniref:glycosyltransferase family 2 protein n=1 Tax=Winogradskyella sp. UBA3174 TaxID=1947785 RepID=UPI0025F6B034|nr:glycosyltransferase family 2 protein [Winogradskyella sp. UBA3174]|tara:strand:- start:20387 stop:21211 length:825 start_codon:yes stop_codon:yes gene_type:complete
MNLIEISVVISTYNHPEWLQKVLWSFECQNFKNFELIIADDGSTEETKHFIDVFKTTVNFPIKHVWHEDNGFQKTKILNKALLECDADYVLFTDGDCVVRNDFLQKHLDFREAGYFLSGGYFKLPMNISKLISESDIKQQSCFDINWLKSNGLKSSFKTNKITASGLKEKVLNKFTPTTATWNGHNSSGWKKDIIAVNGFDERMQYGGEDRELGERMFNNGIKAKQIRYSAICIHLDHARSYAKPEMVAKNEKIRAITKAEKVIRTPFGIEKLG